MARARRVAQAYRTALDMTAPATAEELDKKVMEWGETWAVPRVITYAPDKLLTVREAADLLCLTTGAVNQLRRRGRLRAQKDRSGTWAYRMTDVTRLSTEPRGRKGQVTDTLDDDGRSAPS